MTTESAEAAIAQSFARLRQDAINVLTAWPAAGAMSGRRDDFLTFVTDHVDAASRDCGEGHLTASALIVNPTAGVVLLTLHPKVGRWLQTGGHCEPGDPSIRRAALREAREESGLQALEMSAAPIALRIKFLKHLIFFSQMNLPKQRVYASCLANLMSMKRGVCDVKV